jgi:hypothetical protein
MSSPLIEFAFTISSYVGFIGNVAPKLTYLTSSIYYKKHSVAQEYKIKIGFYEIIFWEIFIV